MTKGKQKKYNKWKVIVLWVFGAIFALIAFLFISQSNVISGIVNTRSVLALSIAFVLLLITGLLWISVAVAVKESEEL
jgi:polyferredoxin